jgi:glycosyltransferase involved in cell wall biosynthesis
VTRERLLLLTTELHPAGAERIVQALATRLPRDRWEVRVACLRSPGGDEGAVARELEAAGIPVEPLRFGGKLDASGGLRLAKLLRRFRPRIVHAHLFHANLAARLLARPVGGAIVVSTLHIVERRPLRLRELLERRTAGQDDATVCVSEAVARHAQEQLGVAPAAVRVIPNGIDLAAFAPPSDPAAARVEARAALGLPAEGEVVGVVGRLDRQKGQDVLLEAWPAVLEARPTAHLALAGAGPEEAALRAQASRLGIAGRVSFLGFQADVPRVLTALDALCLPSRWEGFGLAAVEALAVGVPSVVTAVDSLPGVVGEAGVLVPSEDPLALGEALIGLLEDAQRRVELSARGPAQAARFEVGRMVQDYAALYEELLTRRPTPP